MVTKTLVVHGLPEAITEENLYDLFDLYGCIEDVWLKIDEDTQRPSTGVIKFRAEECARDALKAVHGLEILGSRLEVRPVLGEGEDASSDGELEFVAEISRPLWDRSKRPAVS